MPKISFTLDSSWKNLYRVGAIAALIAALVFRRNMGAEATMFAGPAPTTAVGWFTLLHNNSLLGLFFLNFFDIADYVLVGLVFLALYIALRKTNRIYSGIATSLSLAGILVYVISTTSFTMLSLSNQYASAATDAQKSAFLTAGQAVLAKGIPGADYQGVGGLTSLFLIAVAGLIISVVMLRGKIFNRITAYVGITASALDLAYLSGLAFLPAGAFYLGSILLIGGAGLLLMIWHLLIGVKLYKLSVTPISAGVKNNE
jgi:hypothetical protein